MARSEAPVRLGIVGCARILPAHLRGLQALRDAGDDRVEITALCARNVEDAARFRQRGEGPPPRPPASTNERDPLGAPHRYVSDLHPDVLPELYDDWRRMLDADGVDAVLILAPVALHHQIALDALRAGKHVLIEKPFAISVAAGRAIVDEARKRDLVLGVAENQRYSESTRALGWAIDHELIGTPQLWLSGGVGGEWSPDRIVAHTPWRHRKLEAGGGGAIDVGVHMMHKIHYVMGPLTEVSAETKIMEPVRFDRDKLGREQARVTNEVEDAFVANLRFANGAIGTVFWSWAGRGERAGLTDDPVIYGSAGCVKGERIVRDDGFHGKVNEIFARQAGPETIERYFPDGVRDTFGLEMRDFIEALVSDHPMETSGKAGLLDLAMAYSILESATANRPVKVEEVLSGTVARYQEEIDAHYHL